MSKIYPNFISSVGPDHPLDRPEQIFFPATSNDGTSKTVPIADAPYVQASPSLEIANVVAMIKPIKYLQMNRVYCISRRVFPKAF